MKLKSIMRGLASFAIIATGLAFIAVETADARMSKGGGIGSRGSKTFQAPPATRTAPNAAAPISRTATPRTATNPGLAANATKPGLLGSMSKGGFMAGLLGAGALGLLLGYGLSGGLGGLGAILGLMLQIGIIVALGMLLFTWWQRRNQQQPAPAMNRQGGPRGLQGGAGQNGFNRDQDVNQGGQSGGLGTMGAAGAGAAAGGMFGARNAAAQPPTRPLNLTGDDFPAFERLLADIHSAFAREDHAALGRLATEEMAGYFAEDIQANVDQGRGVKIANVHLVQGDLAEAWKEPDAEYATVAMRFSLTDAVVDRKSGQVIEGSLTEPQEISEQWTFVRRPGGTPQDWILSAVQGSEDDDQNA